MMTRILLFIIALMPWVVPAQADISEVLRNAWGLTPPPPPPTIKVLVFHNQDGAILEVRGKYKLYDPHSNEHLSTRFVGKSQFIQALRSGLKWGEEFPGMHQISIVPGNAETEIYVNGNHLPGKVLIYDIGGSVSVVNELPIEDFLRYSLANRFPQNLADETLAAMAISQRTDAYYQAQHPKSTYFAMDASQGDYKGAIPIDSNTPIQRALKNTRYMVMSRTGLYEGIVTPFAVSWDASGRQLQKGEQAQISMNDADNLARKGEHAATILEKAFPHSTIQLIPFAEKTQ